jgi:hypothetical protein
MKRTTAIPTINPTDNRPIGVPKLIFKNQRPNASFPTGGLFSTGSLRFDLNNVMLVNLAKEAFLKNSDHKDSTDALNTFLLSLAVTSAFEGALMR